jgi:hypothetical protein
MLSARSRTTRRLAPVSEAAGEQGWFALYPRQRMRDFTNPEHACRAFTRSRYAPVPFRTHV